MKVLFLFSFLIINCSYAQDFISLVKNTESVYSQVMDIDASNYGKLNFETILSQQLVYISASASKLNSSFISLINSDSQSKRIYTKDIYVKNLQFLVDFGETAPTTCNGSGIIANSDTSCVGKNCTINQRIISKCNEEACWSSSPSTPRYLSSQISESFALKGRVNISDCIPNNYMGQKHSLKATVDNTSTTILNGGTVRVNIFLKNDSYTTSSGKSL